MAFAQQAMAAYEMTRAYAAYARSMDASTLAGIPPAQTGMSSTPPMQAGTLVAMGRYFTSQAHHALQPMAQAQLASLVRQISPTMANAGRKRHLDKLERNPAVDVYEFRPVSANLEVATINGRLLLRSLSETEGQTFYDLGSLSTVETRSWDIVNNRRR